MKKDNKLVKSIVLDASDINEVVGGGKNCWCKNNKDLVLISEKNSELDCNNWCCNFEHEYLDDQHGKIYAWGMILSETQEKWKEC